MKADAIELDFSGTQGLRGEVSVPPDKSLSHRAVLFASLAEGVSSIRNFLRAGDPLSTVSAMRMLGVGIEESRRPAGETVQDDLVIRSGGIRSLAEPADVIDCGNSGTTMRLLSGILAGCPFFSVLTGDASLRQRPMARVIAPLRQMGARVSARSGDRLPPLAISGGNLSGIDYTMKVASAQVKSCLLLAGLGAEGTTRVAEPFLSRDHTERMLGSMGAAVDVEGLTVSIRGGAPLRPLDMTVPADFSSAAFFLAAAAMVPGSEVLLRNVGVNSTRTGLLRILSEMGASVEVANLREISGEPVADITCTSAGSLRPVKIGREDIPSVIDEFPVLCVLASLAEGVTEIRGAEELRVKESDRIAAMAGELRKLGVDLEEYPDGIAVSGAPGLTGGTVASHGDHRIAMALSIAALAAKGPVRIEGASCVDISFPAFFSTLKKLTSGGSQAGPPGFGDIRHGQSHRH